MILHSLAATLFDTEQLTLYSSEAYWAHFRWWIRITISFDADYYGHRFSQIPATRTFYAHAMLLSDVKFRAPRIRRWLIPAFAAHIFAYLTFSRQAVMSTRMNMTTARLWIYRIANEFRAHFVTVKYGHLYRICRLHLRYFLYHHCRF